MACSVPYASSSYVSALSKKTIKESNRWPQQQHSSPSSSSSHPFPSTTSGSHKGDDGGWSMGIPEKGSGWSGARLYNTNSESEASGGSEAGVIAKPDIISRSHSSEQKVKNLWMSGRSSDSSYLRQGLDWTSDNDEENRSQSPGGLTMITSKGGDSDTADAPQDDFVGVNNWGNPKTRSMVSNNWKMQPSLQEKDSCPASDWDDAELAENPQYFGVTAGNHTLSKEQLFCQAELEGTPSFDIGNGNFIGDVSHSGAGTPNSRSSGGATPTQEIGGRTSAGSTSSDNSIGSSSSLKSDGKGSKSYSNRLGSPRKPSRYDRSNSQSGTSSVSSEKDSNAPFKTRKPKKSLAELEGGLGSLHCEPSGWGELPSPKPCDVDNGTELWGVPPADKNRLVAADKNSGSLSGQSWGDAVQVASTPSSVEWREEDSSGALAAGWSKDEDSKIPTTPMSQWGQVNESSWSNNFKDNVSPYGDGLKSVSDMKSPENDYHKTCVDSDMFESVNDINSDTLYPQNGMNKKHSQGSSPNGAFGYGISSDSQHLSTVKQTPPHSSVAGSSVQNQLLFLKLLQGNSGQQVLTQRLGQLQMHKQQLLQQLNQLSKSSGQGGTGMNTTVQQQNQTISHKLTTIGQMIGQINQQLMILSQLSSQQKDISKNSEAGSSNVPSPKIMHNAALPGPIRLKNDPKGNASFGRSQSANAVTGLNVEPSRSLAYGVQGLSLNSPVQSSVSQSSARSMSRLQQIISGSSSNDTSVSASGRGDNASSMPTTPGTQNSAFTAPGSLQVSNATSPFSPPQSGSLAIGSDNRLFMGSAPPAHFTSKKAVSDIQEFRPGVPWQPKSQATEPAQVYSKQAAMPTVNSYHEGNMYGQLSGPQQPSFGSNVHLMRSQSASGSWNNSGIGPQSKYSPNSGQGIGYENQVNMRVGHNPYVHGGQCQPKPSTPHQEMINMGSSWKSKGRTVVPPSSLYPTPDFQYKPGFGVRKHHRMAGVPQSQYSTAADQRGWASPLATDAPSSSSSMISHTVWGPESDPVSHSEDSPQRWGQGYKHGRGTWMDARLNKPHDPPSSFNSQMHCQSKSSSPHESYTSASVDSLSSRRSTWGQDELHSLSTKQGMVSPEPTFAEWQAGKKARLSVSKFSSNPPSPWLIIRNKNTQVTEDTLKEVFSKYGAIKEWIVCPASDCVLLSYQSTEDSIRIKEYIDNNSDLLGINVIVQFASKADVDLIIEQSRMVSPRSRFHGSSSGTARLPPPEDLSSASPCTPFSTAVLASEWDTSDSNAPSSLGRQSSDATTPGSSLWSDSGFLSGLSSPWHGSLTVPGAAVTSSTTSPQTSTGTEGEQLHTSSNPSISPFLPNGLL